MSICTVCNKSDGITKGKELRATELHTFEVQLWVTEHFQQQRVAFDEETFLAGVVSNKVDIPRAKLGVPSFKQ
jgi:hypothetical protein